MLVILACALIGVLLVFVVVLYRTAKEALFEAKATSVDLAELRKAMELRAEGIVYMENGRRHICKSRTLSPPPHPVDSTIRGEFDGRRKEERG